MFIPLRDLNPRRTVPVVTLLLIAANVGAFLYQLSLPPRAGRALVYTLGMVPNWLPQAFAGAADFSAVLVPLLTSMFLHGGFLHLAGNMLFLWIFGDNVEDFLGHLEYLIFYVICGVAAGLAHTLSDLGSTTPALGASGAISGVMGAYMVLYPRSRVLTLFFIFLIPVPAVIILGWWFLLQFLGGLGSIGMRTAGGVAWWAHIGGFLLGAFLMIGAKRR